MQVDPTSFDRMTGALRGLLWHDPLMARSRKVSGQAVSEDRILLTFPKAALTGTDDPNLLAAILGATLPERFLILWKRATVIHLGLDEADTLDGLVRKLYLEFTAEDTPERDLAYLALKVGRETRLNRYDIISDPEPILDTLDLPCPLARPTRHLAGLGLLLRVSEEGSPRLSLDISLADCEPDAAGLAALFDLVLAVNPEAQPPAFWPSHVAVGRDREKTLFVTLYGWPDGKVP